MKFSGKMCLKVMLKSHKKPEFLPLFRRYAFRKATGWGQIDPSPSRFRVKFLFSRFFVVPQNVL